MGRIMRRNLIKVTVPGFTSCTAVMQAELLKLFCDTKMDDIFARACIQASIPKESCVCASACVLVLAGAPERDAIWGRRHDLRRSPSGAPEMISYSNIGVHRPTAEWLGAASGTDAIAAMQRVRSTIAQALGDFEVSLTLLDLMYQTASGNVRFLTDDEVRQLLPLMSPSWEEKATQTCGSGTVDETVRARSALESAGQKDTAPYRILDAQLRCLGALQMVESLALKQK